MADQWDQFPDAGGGTAVADPFDKFPDAAPTGRQIVKNTDGSVSTELTATVGLDNRFYNVPTLYSGQRVTPDEAVRRVRSAGMKDPETGLSLTPYVTISDAVSAAKERSSGIGKLLNDPFSQFHDAGLPDHSDQWNQTQADLARNAEAAGIPATNDSRKRLTDAIGRVEGAGFQTPHFINQPNEPTGDRGVTRDIENLVSSLKKQESTIAPGPVRDALSRQRAYWEQEASAGMSANEWKKQTGEPEPLYPHEQTNNDPFSAFPDAQPDKTFMQKAGDVLGTVTEGVARGLLGPANLLIPTDTFKKPLLSPETAQAIVKAPFVASGINQASSGAAGAVKGALEGTGNVASGLTSPENLALLGVAPEGKLGMRLVAGVFLGQSLLGTPQQWQALKDAPTTAEKVRIGTEMGLGLALPAAGLAHSFKGEGLKTQSELRPTAEPPTQGIADSTSSLPPVEAVASEALSQKHPLVSELPLPESQAVPQPNPTNPLERSQQASGLDAFLRQKGFDPAEQPVERLSDADMKRYPITRAILEYEKASGLKEADVNAGPPTGQNAPQAEIAQPSVDAGPVVTPETPTGTKNAVTDAERMARDIAPAVEAAKQDFGSVWDESAAILQNDPSAHVRLVESLADNPRALTDTENALLLHRQIEVQTEHDAAVRAVNEAPTAEARTEAQARLDRVRDDVQTVYDAAKVAGTETSRGLNSRKMLANQDYTLVKMEATTRAVVNKGRPLSDYQANQVKDLHQRISIAESKLAAYDARDQFNAALKQAKADAKKTGFKAQDFLDQQARNARERIAARRSKLYADPIGITQVAHLADEAIIGASHLARGITKFADWSAQMIAEFGERIKPHLQALFAKAQAMHAEAAKSKMLSPEERLANALAGDKKRIAGRIEQIQKDTEAGNFVKPERKPPRMDQQKADLLYEYGKAKEAYNRGLIEAQLKQQSIPRKIFRMGGEIVNTSRAIMTSFDMSAVLRQGGFVAFGHPIRALKNFPDMFRAFGSERAQHRINAEIMSRPNAPKYIRSKLYLSDDSVGTKLSRMEEAYMSRWAKNIPIVAGSERAYTTFLNKLRADSFDAMEATLAKKGVATPAEERAIANAVNIFTGRGDMGAAAQAAVGLNTVFFAPRYVLSRFQLLTGQPLYRGTFRTRMLIAREYGRFFAGAALVYALGKSSGATVETDPRSSDFGKLKFGDTRVDVLAGIGQTTVFGSRIISGKTMTGQGKIVPITGKLKYGHETTTDVVTRFLRTKLSPLVGAALDIRQGENVVGQPVTPQSAVTQMAVPLSFGDIYAAMQEQGVVKGTALAILALFGMGVQKYSAKPHHQ